MSSPIIDWNKAQRQSPAALIVLLFKALTRLLKLLWPLLIVFLLNRKSGSTDKYEIITLVISVFSVFRSVLEYYNFRFRVADSKLIITEGLFVKKTITLPIEKIQAVHSEQTWLHTILNVSRLSFDSAGSEKMEVKIEALDKRRAAAFKDFILKNKQQEDPIGINDKPTKEQALITLGSKDLLKLGFSANHLETFFLLIAFGFSILNNAGISDKEYKGLFAWLYESLGENSVHIFLLLIILILIISISVSVFRILLIYSNFVITKSAKGFQISSGLINKKEKIVPFEKIQFISWRANWIREIIGLFILQFHATGSGLMQHKQQLKVPVTNKNFIPLLLEQYHPLLLITETPVIKIHKAYVWRRILLLALLPSIILLPLMYYYSEMSILFLLPINCLIGVSVFLFQKKYKLWIGQEALQIKKGVWGIHELIMRWENIQSVHLEQSIYQRRHQLASVVLHSAGGQVKIPYIELGIARDIQNYALFKIENSDPDPK